eukprot:6193613-Pleurochrysis_carterae.AAC.3
MGYLCFANVQNAGSKYVKFHVQHRPQMTLKMHHSLTQIPNRLSAIILAIKYVCRLRRRRREALLPHLLPTRGNQAMKRAMFPNVYFRTTR